MHDIAHLLKYIVSDKNLHARFLNSLSYLEYRGSRKMARALSTADVDDAVLSHAMEETRHALYFKKLAIKEGGEDFRHYRSETLLADAAIKRYFYELDHQTGEFIKARNPEDSHKKEVYHLVTWLIEERAISIYKTYERLLAESGGEISLKPVLADEAAHLRDVKFKLDPLREARQLDMTWLLALEEKLFDEAWSEIERQVENHAPAYA